MKWRCTWCGKPHAEDDPPCDNCGHNTFEEAIVRQDETDREVRTVDTGTTYVWVCSNCGREHVKFNPPCSRCGEHDLEKTEQHYADVDRDLEVSSWLDVAKPYTPVFAVVGIVVLLFATGIVSPSILPGIGTPTPPDAPGWGDEAGGIDLDVAEEQAVAQLAAERGDDGRVADDGLAAYAEYHNRVLIANEYGDAAYDRPDPDEFGLDCRADLLGNQFAPFDADIDGYVDADELADDASTVVRNIESATDEYGAAAYGFDLHVGEDGTVYVFYAAC